MGTHTMQCACRKKFGNFASSLLQFFGMDGPRKFPLDQARRGKANIACVVTHSSQHPMVLWQPNRHKCALQYINSTWRPDTVAHGSVSVLLNSYYAAKADKLE